MNVLSRVAINILQTQAHAQIMVCCCCCIVAVTPATAAPTTAMDHIFFIDAFAFMVLFSNFAANLLLWFRL